MERNLSLYYPWLLECEHFVLYPWPIPGQFFITHVYVVVIVEDNKLKQGKFLPGMKIPIISKENLKKKSDYLLVLAWNFFDEIKKKNADLAHKFISIKDLEI